MNSAIGYEEWKIVPDYNGIYLISNFGNVYSFKKKRLLTPYLRRGYSSVCLCKDSIEKNTAIHRLVATAFIPNPDNKPEVNHKDGIRNNPHVDNLEWVTHSENIRHADRIGLRRVSGEDNMRSILTKEDVLEIRRLRGVFRQCELAERFNVKKRTIQAVQWRQNWKHI